MSKSLGSRTFPPSYSHSAPSPDGGWILGTISIQSLGDFCSHYCLDHEFLSYWYSPTLPKPPPSGSDPGSGTVACVISVKNLASSAWSLTHRAWASLLKSTKCKALPTSLCWGLPSAANLPLCSMWCVCVVAGVGGGYGVRKTNLSNHGVSSVCQSEKSGQQKCSKVIFRGRERLFTALLMERMYRWKQLENCLPRLVLTLPLAVMLRNFRALTQYCALAFRVGLCRCIFLFPPVGLHVLLWKSAIIPILSKKKICECVRGVGKHHGGLISAM